MHRGKECRRPSPYGCDRFLFYKNHSGAIFEWWGDA
nr:MAG TPA: hypothetical protein [Caudoviricetes sp.]